MSRCILTYSSLYSCCEPLNRPTGVLKPSVSGGLVCVCWLAVQKLALNGLWPNGPTAMARARCDSCMEGNMYVVSRGEVSCGFGLGFCVSFASRPRQQINLGTSFPCVPPRFTAAPFHIPPYYFTSLYCRRQRCGFASNPVEFLNGRSSSISAGPREYSASSAYGTLLIKRVHGTFIALGLRQLIPCFF